MANELEPYDSADYFLKREAQEELLKDAIELGDPAYMGHAVDIVARARQPKRPTRKS